MRAGYLTLYVKKCMCVHLCMYEGMICIYICMHVEIMCAFLCVYLCVCVCERKGFCVFGYIIL